MQTTLHIHKRTLENLQVILKLAGYNVRYEKGNFKTGFCLLENTKILVINKFSTLDSKINALITLILDAEIDQKLITDDKLNKFLLILQQTKLQL